MYMYLSLSLGCCEPLAPGRELTLIPAKRNSGVVSGAAQLWNRSTKDPMLRGPQLGH